MRGMIRKGWSAILTAVVSLSLLAVSAQAGEVFMTSVLAVDVAAGQLMSGGMGPANPDFGGLRAVGIIGNCPVMAME